MSDVNLLLKSAEAIDLPALARMNKQLIEDEGHSNPMSVTELEERMSDWLTSDWQIDLLCIDDGIIVGYTVYQYRNDPYYRDRVSVYIRQYFIAREYRRHGYGQAGIKLLQKTRFQSNHTISLEVLSHNHIGMSFWHKAGFSPYSTTMMLSPREVEG